MTFKIVAGTPVRIAELILGYNGEKMYFSSISSVLNGPFQFQVHYKPTKAIWNILL
jgi:hypothetical protein